MCRPGNREVRGGTSALGTGWYEVLGAGVDGCLRRSLFAMDTGRDVLCGRAVRYEFILVQRHD